MPDERYGVVTISGPSDPVTLSGDEGLDFFIEARRAWMEHDHITWSTALESTALKYVIN